MRIFADRPGMVEFGDETAIACEMSQAPIQSDSLQLEKERKTQAGIAG
ncbi:hypothetical protein [Baaleninema sp.]